MYISEINIYPIKSLKGINLQSAVIEKRGLELDRRWVLVDANGKFLTQRDLPRMATIRVAVKGDGLEVWAADAPKIRIDPIFKGPRVTTLVWNSTSDAIAYDVNTNQWFSDVLGTEVELRYMPDDAGRPVNALFDRGGDKVSFADGYPLMLLGEASLADLNDRILSHNGHTGVTAPLPMNRFRPNLVVAGSEPFAEDKWERIRIGDTVFRSTKPSERCVITTVDQSLGEFDGKEPLRTLAAYRRAREIIPDRLASYGMDGTEVLFGQNLIPETPGSIVKIGDRVEVL